MNTIIVRLLKTKIRQQIVVLNFAVCENYGIKENI